MSKKIIIENLFLLVLISFTGMEVFNSSFIFKGLTWKNCRQGDMDIYIEQNRPVSNLKEAGNGGILVSDSGAVEISDIIYKDEPHFRVETDQATWYIEKSSGGASSLVDGDGNDWIDFSKSDVPGKTNFADSEFRGLPNLVFKDPGNGIGHPGFDVCQTKKVKDNELLVVSNNNDWQLRWIFFRSYAIVKIEEFDPGRKYWFLYEGAVAGNFDPSNHFWGTGKDGKRTDTPSIFKNPESGLWDYAFFGTNGVDRTLFLSQLTPDKNTDFFAYMGNEYKKDNASNDGMNVFGFGRSLDTEPLLEGESTFCVGFFQREIQTEQDEKGLSAHISTIKKNHLGFQNK